MRTGPVVHTPASSLSTESSANRECGFKILLHPAWVAGITTNTFAAVPGSGSHR